MPSSSTNTTNVSSSGSATHLSSHPTVNKTNTSTANAYDPASDLGYGVGRLFRGAFDLASSAWQSWWNPNLGPSPEEIAKKQQAIYVAGVKECIQHLEPALENVRKNPNDPASLGKIDDLSQHYAAYVNVAPAMELNAYQQQLFQPISEQIERLSDPSLKQKLKMLLPVLAIGSSAEKNKKTHSAIQNDEYGVPLSQAYYDEEKTVKNPPNEKRHLEQISTSTLNMVNLPLDNQINPAFQNKRAVMQQSFPASFDLNNLNGNNGFMVPGIASGGYLGGSVSTAGDINGDNITDLVLGAFNANSGNGAAYVIFGSRGGFTSPFDLTSLNGNNGFMVPAIALSGYLGISVSTAGDINGDNITDLILGAPFANSYNGTAYVIFGSRGGFVSPFNLSNLNGSNGFMVPGISSNGELGSSVSTAGDINGDNITDLVLGAPVANSNNGTAYVIFGSRGGFTSPFNLTNLNGNNGFMVPGIASGGYLGISVSTAGDINGDNITDLVLGAYAANSRNGTAYVIFGSRGGFTSPFNLTNLNGNNGFMVPGIASNGYLGISVSTAGDINGDNITDLVLGAYQANSNNGTAYVIFGSSGGFTSPFNLSNLNGSNGFMVPGIASTGQLGSVSTAGDIDGDNITDLVLGAYGANSGNGTAYVIFGSRGGFTSPFNLTNLNSSNGFMIPGIASTDNLGSSVSTAGDINGDNITDIVLGAPGNNGTAYVIFGQNTVVTPTPTSTSMPASTPTPTPTFTTTPIMPTPVTTPTPTATFVPPSTTNLTPCPSNQPLTLDNHNIQINQGQNLRLTPNDLSATCGNSTAPNLGTNFTITGITHAEVQTRNSSGFWNNASSFLGIDLSEGNIALLQDNSTFPPELNISITDGETILNSPVRIDFSTNQSMPVVSNITFSIRISGTTILNATQFQIMDTGTPLDNVVISVTSVQGGYFSLVNTSTPISDFTYYQLQNGQIQFVHNGTALPKITFSVGDGSGQPIPVSPLVSFFNINQSNTPSVPLAAVIGGALGAVAITAAIGLSAFGIFKHRQNQERKEKQTHQTPELKAVANPLQMN